MGQVPVKNLQTIPVLAAPLRAQDASSTIATLKSEKARTSMVDGKAFTNENSAVTDGDFNSFANSYIKPASDRISLYTVRPGDTLAQIAEMYGVTQNTILWANDLKKGTALQPDQVLIILPISGYKYIVKKGDTIASVAKAYKTTADEIALFNALEEGDKLAVGTEIIIPDADGSLAEADKKANTKTGTKGSDKSSSGKKTGVDSSGYFARPIRGGTKTQGIHGHNGIDLASYYGAPILAAADGQVIVSKVGGWGGGYGNYVVIQHGNGMQTLYAHMSEVMVSVGQRVEKGQQVGKMGSTGRSTGTHLHFEVRGGKNPF